MDLKDLPGLIGIRPVLGVPLFLEIFKSSASQIQKLSFLKKMTLLLINLFLDSPGAFLLDLPLLVGAGTVAPLT